MNLDKAEILDEEHDTVKGMTERQIIDPIISAMQRLPEKMQLQLFRAMSNYVVDGQEPDLHGIPGDFWGTIRPKVEILRRILAENE